MQIQSVCYTEDLLEDRQVFESIVSNQPQFCRAAVIVEGGEEKVVGYLFAHTNERGAPPPHLGKPVENFPKDGGSGPSMHSRRDN
eukprot:136146-Rhodomonas_salina.5